MEPWLVASLVVDIQYLGFNQEWVSGADVGSEFGCEY